MTPRVARPGRRRCCDPRGPTAHPTIPTGPQQEASVAMASELADLVLSLYRQLIDQIMQSRPAQTNGHGFTPGYVYSQLLQGTPIDPVDFIGPYTPNNNSPLQDAVGAYNQSTPAGPAPPTAGGSGTSTGTSDPAIDGSVAKFRQAMQAAYNTSVLVDSMIMITGDDVYEEYPTTRHISFAYNGVLQGIQPLPPPPLAPDVQARVDAARQLLWTTGVNGEPVRTPIYKEYIKLSGAYSDAKANYTRARILAENNPVLAQTWPSDSIELQQEVDETYDDWKTAGADQVEAALATVESEGVDIQQQMVVGARKAFDAWSLPLSGVPVVTPYSSILPSGWCDPDDDDEGWEKLDISSASSQSTGQSASGSGFASNWHTHTSSSGGGGFGGFGGFGFVAAGGQTGSSSSASSSANDHWTWTQGGFKNDASGLSIHLEWALCDIQRPWLTSDLFYLSNWYLVGEKKGAISDGSIAGQALDQNKLLPMIPTQFLVVRNMKIKANDWGQDGEFLSSTFAQAQSDSSSSNQHVSGRGGFSIGFLNIGGSAAHGSVSNSSSSSSSSNQSSSFDIGWSFQNGVLEMRGAQILGWLSEIVPAAAPLDSPAAPSPTPTPSGS